GSLFDGSTRRSCSMTSLNTPPNCWMNLRLVGLHRPRCLFPWSRSSAACAAGSEARAAATRNWNLKAPPRGPQVSSSSSSCDSPAKRRTVVASTKSARLLISVNSFDSLVNCARLWDPVYHEFQLIEHDDGLGKVVAW